MHIEITDEILILRARLGRGECVIYLTLEAGPD